MEVPNIPHHKVRGSEMEHLRADPPSSCIYVDGDILCSFFIQRQIDKESNPSGL